MEGHNICMDGVGEIAKGSEGKPVLSQTCANLLGLDWFKGCQVNRVGDYDADLV